MTDQLAQRAAVVEVALTWEGTPYHHMARVKGAGVDCATLLQAVFVEAGLIEDKRIDYYPPDWHLHRSQERYLEQVCAYAREIAHDPEPGDVVLWRFGRCFSHGAIVVKWPIVIHAYVGRVCMREDVAAATWLNWMTEGPTPGAERPRRFFSYWA
jgi:cell wall-associated NlpC family hydrolase